MLLLKNIRIALSPVFFGGIMFFCFAFLMVLFPKAVILSQRHTNQHIWSKQLTLPEVSGSASLGSPKCWKSIFPNIWTMTAAILGSLLHKMAVFVVNSTLSLCVCVCVWLYMFVFCFLCSFLPFFSSLLPFILPSLLPFFFSSFLSWFFCRFWFGFLWGLNNNKA